MIRVRAYAKINLFLEITGKRSDGYHGLSTVFQKISLADELTFAPAETLSLTCSDSSLPTDERNLAMRAALQVQALLKEKRGARIHLKKCIPMGAGLGGGSSDAAAVMATLPRLWKRRVSPTVFHRCARTLGADVPFFLHGGTCVASGIGDRLRPLRSLKKTWIVVVYPGFGVPTKEAYARVRLPFQKQYRVAPMLAAMRDHQSASWLPHLFNRFEEFVFPTYPELPLVKQRLIQAGCVSALMSGSGSCLFGVARSSAEGRKALRILRPQYPQSWLVHT